MEIQNVIEGLGKAFEEFKSANDLRLQSIEKKGSADVVLTEKVERINAAVGELDSLKAKLEALETRAARPQLGPNGQEIIPEQVEHRKAFSAFLRKGIETGLAEIERKSNSIGTSADGGYALPKVIDAQLAALLVDISPMRQLANVVSVSTSDYRKLMNIHGTSSGWVGETAARSATNTSQLAEIPAVMGELFANPQATQTMLDDVFFDAEAWIAQEVALEFSRAEGVAFVTGSGTNQPKGLVAGTTAATADGARAFGTIEHIATGVAGGWAASNPADTLISVAFKLKAGHRANATWQMGKALLGEVRGFKDSTGQYLFQPSMVLGTPSMLLGYPVIENEAVAAKSSGSISAIFGDIKAAYTIVDRIGTRMLRDPYSAKPYVGFYCTRRVGGMLVNSEAVKVAKFSVS